MHAYYRPRKALLVIAALIALVATLLTPGTAHADGGNSFLPANIPGYCVRHAYFLGEISPCPPDPTAYGDFSFKQVPALGRFITPNTTRLVSLESTNFPGWYLRHENFRIKLSQKPAGGDPSFRQFALDASFYRVPGLTTPEAVSFESLNFGGFYIRHSNYDLWLSPRDSWNLANDATFYVR
jgi:hypothetical protein